MFITVCLYLATLDSLSQHISFRSPVHFINNVSTHVIVQLFKHKAICSTNIYKVYCMCQEFYCRATDYTQFLASRSLSKVSDKMSKRHWWNKLLMREKNSELCLIWWYTQNQSVIHELTSIFKCSNVSPWFLVQWCFYFTLPFKSAEFCWNCQTIP